MQLQKGFGRFGKMVAVMLLLSGCASTIFPDFEDDSDVIIDEGGNVEVRKVEDKGILVADKENAVYEEDKPKEVILDTVEKVELAKVVAVEEEKLDPLVTEEKENKVETAKVEENTSKDINDENLVAEEDKVETPEVPSMHYLAQTIHFENGGAVVASSYNASLKKIAKLAKEHDAKVTVYGFASSRTRDTDPASHKLANFKVSAERAENTAKALRRLGVPAENITTQALSDSMPMYQEVMPEGERLNRRAEIYLTY